MAKKSARKKRKAKSVQRIGELLESGKAKQKFEDLSNATLTELERRGQGKSGPKARKTARGAVNEGLKRGGASRATARSRRSRRKKR